MHEEPPGLRGKGARKARRALARIRETMCVRWAAISESMYALDPDDDERGWGLVQDRQHAAMRRSSQARRVVEKAIGVEAFLDYFC